MEARGSDSWAEEPPRRPRAGGAEARGDAYSRVRGPAEALSARGEARGSRGYLGGADGGATGADEPLPPGAKGADFKTLQEMIARGIREGETGNAHLEKDVALDANDAELRRHREEVKRRREADAAAREKEKEAARERRRREDEQRRRRQTEELEQEELQVQRQREEHKAVEARCRRELQAAISIQALVRGRKSRAGVPIASPVVRAYLHTQPWEPLHSDLC